jgi:hypothetical protein
MARRTNKCENRMAMAATDGQVEHVRHLNADKINRFDDWSDSWMHV